MEQGTFWETFHFVGKDQHFLFVCMWWDEYNAWHASAEINSHLVKEIVCIMEAVPFADKYNDFWNFRHEF